MSMLKVDLELVKKYNVAGPRYTSYPPATKFTETLNWPELAERILENNRTERDLSLYFHIPFCETLCWYCGCTTVITLNHSQGTTYIEYLDKEVAQMARCSTRAARSSNSTGAAARPRSSTRTKSAGWARSSIATSLLPTTSKRASRSTRAA